MISQFKSRRALKKLRKKRLQKKNHNVRKYLSRYRNSPKRRMLEPVVTGDGTTIVPATSDPRPIDQDKENTPSVFPGAR